MCDILTHVVAPGYVIGHALLSILQIHPRPLTTSMDKDVEGALVWNLAHSLACPT
jgi:hypothetical protein